jgi:hypothetical protein
MVNLNKESEFNYKLDAINSDYEKSKVLGEISDCTSIASNSVISESENNSSQNNNGSIFDKKKEILMMKNSSSAKIQSSKSNNTTNNNIINNESENNQVKIPIDQKTLYREFVKVFLKVKFEQLHNDHRGQKVPQAEVWKEVIKRNINKNNWQDFIYEELKNPSKYEKSLKKGGGNRFSSR